MAVASVQSSSLALAPAIGAYLTDGQRLVQVRGVDARGDFMLEDCGAPCGIELVIIVPLSELLRLWLSVEAYESRKKRAVA